MEKLVIAQEGRCCKVRDIKSGDCVMIDSRPYLIQRLTHCKATTYIVGRDIFTGKRFHQDMTGTVYKWLPRIREYYRFLLYISDDDFAVCRSETGENEVFLVFFNQRLFFLYFLSEN